MKIIIVGGGKIGYYLAKNLKSGEYDISIIEIDRARSQIFANELDVSVVLGNGTGIKVLEQAGIKHCDAIIAVTGKDEDNLVVCQLAKRLYNVKKTIAKVNNPKNVTAMKFFEIDFVISATDNIIRQLEREVDSSLLKEVFPLNDGKASLVEIQLPDNYALSHKTISEIQLPESCNIISIMRGDEFIIPRGKTKLMSHDNLLIVTVTGAVAEVKKALKLKK